MNRRLPVVAGQFYPADPGRLRRALNELWPSPAPAPQRVLAALSPHAGYVYSGRTAARTFARILPAERYVLLGPNHTGAGAAVAVSAADAWATPLGDVLTDQAFVRDLLARCPSARGDEAAHRQEHSLEVQLPFLQRMGGDFRTVCIAVGTWQPSVLEALGCGLAETVQASPGRTVLIASTDMNHFEDLATTQRLDRLALDQVLALDPEGLLAVVRQEDISMCGAAPATAVLTAAKILGARQAELVDYSTSADASQDEDRVVGYAGVLIS